MPETSGAIEIYPIENLSAIHFVLLPPEILIVEGFIEFPTPGFAVQLVRATHQPNSDVLFLDKNMIPPTSAIHPAVTRVPVYFSELTTKKYTQVVIMPGRQTVRVKNEFQK